MAQDKHNPGKQQQRGFAQDRELASEAGKKGGQHSQGGGGQQQSGKNNPGNFANDREKASEAGRKGGQH